jgi:single-strand DNA-binding protein
VYLIGTIGGEPLLYSVGDHSVAELALASTCHWRDAVGTARTTTSWFNLTAWEELAERCGRVLHRGDRIFVAGALQLWTETRGAQSYTCHSIVLDTLVLLRVGAGSEPQAR